MTRKDLMKTLKDQVKAINKLTKQVDKLGSMPLNDLQFQHEEIATELEESIAVVLGDVVDTLEDWQFATPKGKVRKRKSTAPRSIKALASTFVF